MLIMWLQAQCLVVLVEILCFTEISEGVTFAPETEDSLRDSLMSTYDKEVRPKHTVDVTVTMHLISINGLDTKSQTFSTTAYFILQWQDSRLVWNSSDYGNVDALFFDEETIWRPTVVISNEVSKIDILHNENVPIRVLEGGYLEWSPPLLMETSCDLDISFYPFDTQECSIYMRTWAYYIEEVDLIADYIDLDDYSDGGEWTLESYTASRTQEKKSGDDYSTLSFTFKVKRRPGHYVMYAIVPSVLMSLLSPIVFLLPAESGEKVSYIITVFLAYAVLLSLIIDQLPTSSHSTSGISVYLTIITVFGAIVVFTTVKILEIYHRDENENIPNWMLKTINKMEVLVCRGNHESQMETPHRINVVTPGRDDKNETLATDMIKPQSGKKTWKEIAAVLDAFLFRLTLIAISAVGFLFVLVNVIYYTT